MNKIDTKGLLLKIFIPTIVLCMSYLVLGHLCNMPYILLFCILGTFTLFPIELGMILYASKKEHGTYSLKSAFAGQEKLALWKKAEFVYTNTYSCFIFTLSFLVTLQ